MLTNILDPEAISTWDIILMEIGESEKHTFYFAEKACKLLVAI